MKASKDDAAPPQTAPPSIVSIGNDKDGSSCGSMTYRLAKGGKATKETCLQAIKKYYPLIIK
ncbi:MAG: hypothetical protein PHV82_17870 [Victivallaceae bacterium]|nr:hypothetical protein [Victivallaceae bacterium]